METASSSITFSSWVPTLARPNKEFADWDNERIQRAQGGNLEAFNELVLAYQDIVFRQACWMLNESAEAEDATQEAFLRAYRRLDTYNGNSFRAWVLKITTNVCLDQIRKTSRHPHIPLDAIDENGEIFEPAWLKDPAETPEMTAERAETGQRIGRAIQNLSPDYRTAVILVDLQELDYNETARILHIPMGTLKSRLARARRQLRVELQ